MGGFYPSILRSWEKYKGMPHLRARSHHPPSCPGRGPRHGWGRWRRQRVSVRDVARFCHSSLIIMGVSGFVIWRVIVAYYELFACSSVSWVACLFSCASAYENKILSLVHREFLRPESSSAAQRRSPTMCSARTKYRESRCLRNRYLSENPIRSYGRLGFWGATTRLLSLHATSVNISSPCTST